MTDLDKNVSELKHKITNLEYDIKDAMEQRYMKYTVVSRDVASMLDTAQSYEKQIDNLLSRINNQVCPLILLYLLNLPTYFQLFYNVNIFIFKCSLCNIMRSYMQFFCYPFINYSLYLEICLILL